MWACSYLWWMSWLYRLPGGGWRGSAGKCLGIVVGHTPLCQHHPAPTAADAVFRKQEDGLIVPSVAFLVLWYLWSTGASVIWSPLHVGEDMEKMREASGNLKNRTQEEGWEGVGCLVWREGERSAQWVCSVWKTAVGGETWSLCPMSVGLGQVVTSLNGITKGRNSYL